MTANRALTQLDVDTPTLVWLLLAVVLLVMAGASAVRAVNLDQRAVVIRLGRACRVRGPGLVLSVPGLERVQMLSLSPTSTGGVTLRGRTDEGVRVILGLEAVYEIVDPLVAVETHLHTASRLVDDLRLITQHELSGVGLPQLIDGREHLATRLQAALNVRAPTWGVRVLEVKINTVEAELDRELLRWVR